MNRAEQREKDFARALDALTEGAGEAKSALEIDGVIQRFEFTYELFWKLLSDRLREQGLDAQSPKRCFGDYAEFGIVTKGRDWDGLLTRGLRSRCSTTAMRPFIDMAKRFRVRFSGGSRSNMSRSCGDPLIFCLKRNE
jgi:hypothetical protein